MRFFSKDGWIILKVKNLMLSLLQNFKIVEAIGMVFVLISWGLGLWGVNKYSTESSQLSADFQEQSQYYQHVINLLATKLDVEVAKTQNIEEVQHKTRQERIKLQEKHGTVAFALYDINDLNEIAWDSFLVRKKWLDVVVAKIDYINETYDILNNCRIKNNIGNIKELEEAHQISQKYFTMVTQNYIDPLKTVEYGLPFVPREKTSHFAAMQADRELTIPGIIEGIMKGRKVLQNKLDEKKNTRLYLGFFLIGSLLVVFAKILEHYQSNKVNH